MLAYNSCLLSSQILACNLCREKMPTCESWALFVTGQEDSSYIEIWLSFDKKELY